MSSLSLALRNLVRNRRRSLAALLTIAVGTAAILLFGGYGRYIQYGMQTDLIRDGGHLQIQTKGYFLYGAGNPVEYGIANYRHIIDVVRNDPVLAPMLSVVTPVLQLGGIAGNFDAGVSRTAVAIGVDVSEQNEMQRWNEYGLTGKPQPLPLTGTGPDAAVIGVGLARVLQVCPGATSRGCAADPLASSAGPGGDTADHNTSASAAKPGQSLPVDVARLVDASMPPAAAVKATAAPEIELLAATALGAPNVARLNVAKVVTQGAKELDDMYIGMHLPQAQRLVYGGDDPRVTAVVVQLRHTEQIPAAEARLNELMRTSLRGLPLEVQEFTTLNPSYGQTLQFLQAMSGFIAVLIGVIVLFTVSSAMSSTVTERTAEIGTLRAMGLRRFGIQKMFSYEGVALGVLGSLGGAAFAVLVGFILNTSHIITYTPPGRVDPVPLTVRVGGIDSVVAAVLSMTVITMISSWFPARRAAKTNIVEALRHA